MARRHSLSKTNNNRMFQSCRGRIDAPLDQTFIEPMHDYEDEEKYSIDLSEMSVTEIKELRSSDPFMYYSIPEIRVKSYLSDGWDSDEEMEDGQQQQEEGQQSQQQQEGQQEGSARERRRSSRLSVSMSAELLADADISRSTHSHTFHGMELRGSVTRKHRLSTEGHLSLIMEDILDDPEFRELDEEESQQSARALGLGFLFDHDDMEGEEPRREGEEEKKD